MNVGLHLSGIRAKHFPIRGSNGRCHRRRTTLPQGTMNVRGKELGIPKRRYLHVVSKDMYEVGAWQY